MVGGNLGLLAFTGEQVWILDVGKGGIFYLGW